MTKYYPPPIISTEPGTWANSTVSVRWPGIARRVMEENKFSSEIVGNISRLIEDIPENPIRQLWDRYAPDHQAWQGYLEPFIGKNWLEVPWFLAEHYFYRRIMEAVDYFSLRVDPFGYQKEQGLIKSESDIQSYISFLSETLSGSGKREKTLRDSLYFSLWGNQADLSLWPAGSDKNPKHSSQKTLKDHLLADNSDQVIKILVRKKNLSKRVDILLDNAGFELVCDLGLADELLSYDLANEVVLHVKAHPTFVSDVIQADLRPTIDFLLDSQQEDVRLLGKRLDQFLGEEQIKIRPDFFWNSPLPMWDLPGDLGEDFQKSALLISKGDANYRRLLGDRMWDYTLPFGQVVDFLPVPICALRSLKAELVVGLKPDQIPELNNLDPDWMVDGKWAVIQYASKKTPG